MPDVMVSFTSGNAAPPGSHSRTDDRSPARDAFSSTVIPGRRRFSFFGLAAAAAVALPELPLLSDGGADPPEEYELWLGGVLHVPSEPMKIRLDPAFFEMPSDYLEEVGLTHDEFVRKARAIVDDINDREAEYGDGEEAAQKC